MKNTIFAGIAAAVTAAFLGLATPASAAPGETSDAQDTIAALEEQGHTVVVNNPGGVPLSEAMVVAVRQGPEQMMSYREDFHDNYWISETTQSIVFVDVR